MILLRPMTPVPHDQDERQRSAQQNREYRQRTDDTERSENDFAERQLVSGRLSDRDDEWFRWRGLHGGLLRLYRWPPT